MADVVAACVTTSTWDGFRSASLQPLKGQTVAAPIHRLSEDAALSLALAVVQASAGPLLLLDGDLAIIGASRSFGAAFEVDDVAVRGATLTQVGAGEWCRPTLQALLVAALSGPPSVHVGEIDLRRPGQTDRRLIVHVERLAYLDMENVRVMVAIFDATKARADQRALADAEQHNLILLREVRHRVANSLQIVASLLLQSARKAQSDEAKSRLADAHHRVMSIAALEHQLAAVGAGASGVDMRTYLTTLCESIAGSMVGDRERIVIAVTGPGGTVEARMSLNLGLIATELVINALKHAFPDERHGKIIVDSTFLGPNWMLTVTDNGVGVPTDGRDVRSGLGTSIVHALATELGATVDISPASPGTRAIISRTAVALVGAIDPQDAVAPATSQSAARG